MAKKGAVQSPPPARKRAAAGAQADHEPAIGAGLASALYFGIALLYMMPAFLPGRNLFGTDYLSGGYFFNEFVSGRLAAGELPKWVPYVYGGLPMYANPGSMFFPVRLIVDLLFPVTWILPSIFVVQFGLAGLGMYLLARELGTRSWIALVAGLAFQLTGLMMSMVYAGHDGRAIVATMAPLCFFFLHRGIRTGSVHPFVGAAAAFGAGLLSFQIQSNYYLLLASALWAAYTLVRTGVVRQPRALATRVALGIAAVALAFTLASVNFLPFFDYVPDSPRGTARGYEYSTSFSMPPGELIGLAVPENHGILGNYEGKSFFKLHTEYVGALVVVLTILGLRYSRRDPDWWFFAGLAAFALTISFGGYTPIYRLYYDWLPGTQQFRAPSISFFLVSFALVAMAALTLERMARDPDRARDRRLVAWLGAIAGAAVVAALINAVGAGDAPRDTARVAGYGRFAVFAVLVCGALWLWSARWLRGIVAVVVFAAITAGDLLIVDRKFFRTVDAPERMFAPDDVVAFLRSQPPGDRVWVSPFPRGTVYRNLTNYLMRFGFEQAGGEHGNQLHRFNEYVGESGRALVDWSNFNRSSFLRAANVRWIITMVDLELDAAESTILREAYHGSAYVYENPRVLPRAYLVPNVIATQDTTAALGLLSQPTMDVARSAIVYGPDPGLPDDIPLDGEAEMVSHEPDRVVVRTTANRPALLVLADNFHRDWRASVNGQEAQILRTNHTFRGVVVPAGQSEVVFEFRPRDFYVGFGIYLATMALFAAYGVGMAVVALRRRRPRASAA